MPKILKEKLGIENENHNTLIQNVRQVKNNRTKTLILLDEKGKKVYVGDINKAPKKYADLKVKSLNKSMYKKNTLVYVILNTKNLNKQTTVPTNSSNVQPTLYKNWYIHKVGDKFMATKEPKFKMETQLPLYNSLKEAKRELDEYERNYKVRRDQYRKRYEREAKREKDEYERNYKVRREQYRKRYEREEALQKKE